MKKTLILFLVTSLFVVSMLLVSCTNDKDTDGVSTNSVLPPASDHEHYFYSWETIVYPTFDSEGFEQRECIICQGVEKNVIPKMTFAEDLEFELNYANMTYSVARNNSYEGRYVAIPNTYNGLPVASINDGAFSGNKNIRCVIIPDSVTQIGKGAFGRCDNLVQVSLPDSLITIRDEAFEQSARLERIVIPDSVRILGDNIFYECTGLKEVVIGRGITEIPGDDRNPLEGMFGKCSSLKSVTIPDTITVIGVAAFNECSSLESVTIPDSVHTIATAAFQNCISLKEIKLGSGVKIIGIGSDNFYLDDGAFLGCRALEEITLPISLETIYPDAFKSCNSLVNVYYEGDIEDWCKIDFRNLDANPASKATNLYLNGVLVSDVVIPDSITAITDYLFAGYRSLKSVTISDSVTSIGQGTFMNCSSLEVINWGKNVQRIGTTGDVNTGPENGVFEGCTSIKSIVIPDSVQVLGLDTFANCESLQDIVIPASVKIICNNSFQNCDKLEKVYFEGELEDWLKIDFGDTYSNPLSNATYFYVNEEFITDITIPTSITKVNSYSFAGYKSLKSVTFPENVEKVGRYAFSDCTSLENVTVYNSSILIDKYAFNNVKEIKFNEYDNAFYIGNEENPYLMLYKAKNTSITSCEIHPSASVIFGSAFQGCENIISIYMPDSIEVIGDMVFLRCFSLETVRISNNLKIMEGSSVFADYSSFQYNLYNGSKYLGNEENPYLLLVSYKEDSNPDCVLHPDTKIIGAGAFSHNRSISTITVPDSVEVICYRAFEYCTALRKVYIPDSVKTVGADLFAQLSNATIYCEADSFPSGWDDDWRLDHIGMIYLGYTKE